MLAKLQNVWEMLASLEKDRGILFELLRKKIVANST